jgi:hypothetical protein
MPAEDLAPTIELFRHRFLHALRDAKLISPSKLANRLSWKHPGFNIHHGGEQPVPAYDASGRKRLADYLLRHPFPDFIVRFLLHPLVDYPDGILGNRLATSLRMAAQSFHRSKYALGDWFRRIRAKLGTKAAVTAAAHKLARILYAMIKHRTPFDPGRLGNPEQSSARRERFLRRQAEGLGFTLTSLEQEAS